MDNRARIKAIEDAAREECYFLSDKQVAELATLQPGRKLLLRFGAGRTLACASQVATTIKAWEAKGDYLRDVSFPVGDPCVRV